MECVVRGLDPLTTNLVVADESRTEKTICLAVSPSLRKYGIPGRARLSVSDFGYGTGEDYLFKLFGIDAELLIDHAWGYESCLMADIKKYQPGSNSLSSGQVLSCAYPYEKGRTVPKPVHGSCKLKEYTSSAEVLKEAALNIYDRIMDRRLELSKNQRQGTISCMQTEMISYSKRVIYMIEYNL